MNQKVLYEEKGRGSPRMDVLAARDLSYGRTLSKKMGEELRMQGCGCWDVFVCRC